ncbi:MAG: helix-turn-helix domain-containing protein [Ktedonobacterales bacterium]|nr:helix-turn-helix domain-containing protein [Ktedonobacterales bacterium]
MSALLMGRVWGYLFQSRAERDIVLALADHAHDDGTSIYPSILNLAWKTELSERQVQRILRSLEERGIIIAVANEEGGRGKKTEWNLYLDQANPKPVFTKGDPSCLIGISYPKKGDISKCDTPKRTRKGDISPPERVTYQQLKGDISNIKGDISTKKRGDEASSSKARSLPNHRTTLDQPPIREPSILLSDGQMPADEALLASPLDESEWELPDHTTIPEKTQAEHGSLTERDAPPVAPPPPTTLRGRGRPANAPKVGPTFAEDSAAVRLALHLRYCLHLRDPRMIVPPEDWASPQIQKWTAEMDRMLRIDQRMADEAAVVITRAVADKFWGTVMHSPASLRKHYDTLRQKFDIGMPDVTTNSQEVFNHAKQTTRSQQSPRRSSIGQAPKGDYAPHVNPIVPSYD